MTVERKYLMAEMERWEVRARNYTFILDCNRPLLAKKNLEHLPWDWKMVAGKCPGYFQEAIQQEIRKTIIWMNNIERGSVK